MTHHRLPIDTVSIVGTVATAALAMSDIALSVTIAVGVSTLIYNILRIIGEIKQWRHRQ